MVCAQAAEDIVLRAATALGPAFARDALLPRVLAALPPLEPGRFLTASHVIRPFST